MGITPQQGWSAATAYDFDRAVMTLARVINARREETVERIVTAPNAPPKGQTVKQVPKYSMRQLLADVADDDDLTDDTGPLPDALRDLPTALL